MTQTLTGRIFRNPQSSTNDADVRYFPLTAVGGALQFPATSRPFPPRIFQSQFFSFQWPELMFPIIFLPINNLLIFA